MIGCNLDQNFPAGHRSNETIPVTLNALKPRALVILESSLSHADAYLRANAIEVAVVTQQTQFLPQIAKLTTDPTPVVRFAATVAMGDLRCSSCQDLIRNLLTDPDAKVRIAAAYSLAKLNDTKYTEQIRAGVSHSDASVRANAVFLLGKLGDPQNLPLLYSVIRDDTSTDMVRMQAVESIARLGDEQIYRTKLWALLISKFNDDRVIGIRGMGALGTPLAVDAIKTMLNDDILEVRLAAVLELARLGNRSGLELVKDYFEDTNDVSNPDVANNLAIMSIGYLKSSQLNNELLKILSSPSEQIRLLGAQSVLLLETRP